MTATPDVRKAMLAAFPSLRAFAFTLTHSVDQADDLVQETILRAWANLNRFDPHTSMRAWPFTILRNAFYSQHRKTRRELEDPDGHYAGRLWTQPEQHGRCDLADMLKAFSNLPVEHREALILIAAEGLSYEEAAQLCAVPVGTMKSRSRLPVVPSRRTMARVRCMWPSISPDELAAWQEHLQAVGVLLEGRTQWPRGGVSVYFRDPDRHLLEIATPGLWKGY